MAKRQVQFGERDRNTESPRVKGLEVSRALAARISIAAKDRALDTEQLLESALRSLVSVSQENTVAKSQPDSSTISNESVSARTTRTTVIKNRTGVIRTSTAIINALQEVLDYNPRLHHNQIVPELWVNDSNYLVEIRRLVEELKTLNALLKEKASPEKEHNTVVDLGKHINHFLDGFAGVAGKGAGWLLIASLGGLLYHTGLVPDMADSVLRNIKFPK